MDPEKTMAFILDAQAKAAVEMAAIRHTLRRAIRLGVREARNQRKRGKVLDDNITRLSAAQLVTEEKLQSLTTKVDQFIAALHPGGNGTVGGEQ